MFCLSCPVWICLYAFSGHSVPRDLSSLQRKSQGQTVSLCFLFLFLGLATASLPCIIFGRSVCFRSEKNPKRVKVSFARMPTLPLSLSKCSTENPCGYADRSPDIESASVDRDCDLLGVLWILGSVDKLLLGQGPACILPCPVSRPSPGVGYVSPRPKLSATGKLRSCRSLSTSPGMESVPLMQGVHQASICKENILHPFFVSVPKI